jgi:hypothetical protein
MFERRIRFDLLSDVIALQLTEMLKYPIDFNSMDG